MTSSQETRPSFRRGGIVCPAGVGGIAHDMKSVCAHPSRIGDGLGLPQSPLLGRRHLLKDPGSNSVVSSRLGACRQPSRAPTHGLFLAREV